MKPVEESVVAAMDGADAALYPYLPYILQDLWEFGANPLVIINLVKKQFGKFDQLRVLDLGCGKGAVSIQLTKALGCTCHGIDAVPEFISYARHKAEEYKVTSLCSFETGDIRLKINQLKNYDVIVLGAIGPVFGDYYETLTSLSECISEHGIFIIDDGYIEDTSPFSHPGIFKKSTIFQQIKKAGMELVLIETFKKELIAKSDKYIFKKIEKRCLELAEKYPGKKNLFLDYIQKQQIENDVLENKIIPAVLLVKGK